MIPPCDPAILDNNPQFKRLYQHLTTTLLNPDGSTRAHDAQPARKAVLEEVKACRIRDAKKQIKQQALRRLAFDPDSSVPDDARDSLAIITFYLESSLNLLDLDDDPSDAADIQSLLAPDINQFYSTLPLLVAPLSTTLATTITDLRAIANTGNETPVADLPRTRARSRQVMRSIAQTPLSSQLADRLRALRQTQLTELPAARMRMAATAAEVLATRAAMLERTVMLLERAKHGAVARATKAKAEHLAMVALGIEGKLGVTKLDILATIHTPEVVRALGRYYQHLRDTRERLEERRVLALEELKGYEDVGGGGADSGAMKEIARRYGGLIREVEDVRMEIERLKIKMADESLSIYDEIEIEDMTFDPTLQIYHYPCPCGDRFEIAIDDLRDGEDIAVCPSCSLMIRVIFDEVCRSLFFFSLLRFCGWGLGL
ncbi:zf-CSL-domain-containing protein [Aspergillus sclerotiicarbonarius CBS 121057]|uniref:Diphthamide biosynthesis protein 3 n=1 Tax=Aspergillus sclerotiicarbonarius (strain CBS 121057 / IBT 28362) TaxID=1448318 RepID=A0A319DWK5_ASPSB|nr:zf-CSL-domain-containing protein [Aspergillus sclerotiicarbonarius CBS 121057]